MKRALALTLAAATALTATAAAAQPYGYARGYDDRDYRYDRDYRHGRDHHRDYRGGRWARGHYLPPGYRGRPYVVYDYGRYGLRPPPRGYYWYRADNDYVLAAIATGLILEAFTGGYDNRGYGGGYYHPGYPYDRRW